MEPPDRYTGVPARVSGRCARYGVILLLPLLLLTSRCDNICPEPEDEDPTTGLPDISTFLTGKSDQFIVDFALLGSGHPFLGARSNGPHIGAHANWHNDDVTWPDGLAPDQYPAIYAPADGFIYRVDYSYPVGSNDRYGIDLAFASDGDTLCLLSYSIEPMCPEPSPDFYRSFILVDLGDPVSKGDIVGYMYIPTNTISHIHFHLMLEYQNSFMAPALFTPALVDSFHAHWGMFGNDLGDPIPPCMGYMLAAEENPFGTGAVDILP
jgi:hypothetical protein